MTDFIDIEKVSTEPVLCLKDYFLTNEEFCLYKNPEFGFLETRPQPLENLSEYYNSEDYISHTDSGRNWFEKIYQFVKTFNIRYKFRILKGNKKKKSLLDYGCGTGDFLEYAKKEGMEVFGVEPDSNALKITQNKIGKEHAASQWKEEQKFDYITLWHVLEHIPNLNEFIKDLDNKLNPDGKIIIAVPNYLSADAKYYKKYWAAYDVPRHLWHFSPDSITRLFDHYGFKLIKKHPLWPDSFYVSLLSEKYKKSKFGIIRAVWVAAKSNFYGIFTTNYSSITYVFEKKTF